MTSKAALQVDGAASEGSAAANREARLKASLGTQAKALFLKNATVQKRAWLTNCFIISTPIFVCVFLVVLQALINVAFNGPDYKCGCACLLCCNDSTGACRSVNSTRCLESETCSTYDENVCGLEYSTARQAAFCEIKSPSLWPALLRVPAPASRPKSTTPAAGVLYTGSDQAEAGALSARLFTNPDPTPAQTAAALALASQGAASGAIYAGAVSLLGAVLGTYSRQGFTNYYLDPAFGPSRGYNASLYLTVANASSPGAISTARTINQSLGSIEFGEYTLRPTVAPVSAKPLWAPSSDDIDSTLYCGYRQARCNGTTNSETWTQAYDWQDSAPGSGRFNVRMWYNATGRFGTSGNEPPNIARVNQGINLAANAFLRRALGDDVAATLVGIMGMPKNGNKLSLDFGSLLGPIFYTWLLQLLLPVMLVNLVYEKERRLRTIMKMHGLGDGAYWAIQYAWFWTITMVYTWVLIGFGSAIGLSFFTKTDYSFQFVFYLLWTNVLIGMGFLLSTLFSSTKTALVASFLYVFGTGLLGFLILQQFISTDKWWLIFLELVPGFGLYRGLYAISQYAFKASWQGTPGFNWSLVQSTGVGWVMIIFAAEWVLFMALAWYLEQVIPSGIGVPRHPLFFLGFKRGRRGSGKQGGLFARWHKASVSHETVVELERPDVRAERARVEALAPGSGTPVVIRDLHKTFPPMGGNKEKAAVRGLTMAVSRGECFGLLGPNGAGKSTTLNILTGFLTPSAGTAFIEGHDITSDMASVYSLMGVCPQDNLLWEQLSGREHLLFYGRLKNLHGADLHAAVESGLRSVNLWAGGVADRQSRRYSGGMKRRLSVAISFMGDPLVVYLDEPSTGLDPASRHNLWDVVKQAKRDRGLILTTHSMEEATVLCDRLGIFVDGQLVCLGNPKELTSRYGGYYVFTITTPPEQEAAADDFVRSLAPGARLTYALAGTRKYELPVGEVTLPGVFEAMGGAGAQHLTVLDWGVANATLEEVFIDLAKQLGAEGGS